MCTYVCAFAQMTQYGSIEQVDSQRRTNMFQKHRAVLAVVGATLLIAAIAGSVHYALGNQQVSGRGARAG